MALNTIFSSFYLFGPVRKKGPKTGFDDLISKNGYRKWILRLKNHIKRCIA